MGTQPDQDLINYLPLDELEKEIIELIASERSEEEMIKALKKGDKIITIGGIHGTINGFKGKDGGAILLQVDSSAKITINRSSISSLASAGNDEPTEVIESGS